MSVFAFDEHIENEDCFSFSYFSSPICSVLSSPFFTVAFLVKGKIARNFVDKMVRWSKQETRGGSAYQKKLHFDQIIPREFYQVLQITHATRVCLCLFMVIGFATCVC